MYLIEAIIEKSHIKENADMLARHIKESLFVYDDRNIKFLSAAINTKLSELDELYNKYQKFARIIESSKSSIAINLDGTKLALTDAIAIRDAFQSKLDLLLEIYEKALKVEDKSKVSLDLDDLFDKIRELKVDVRTLTYRIDQAIWSTDISIKD